MFEGALSLTALEIFYELLPPPCILCPPAASDRVESGTWMDSTPHRATLVALRIEPKPRSAPTFSRCLSKESSHEDDQFSRCRLSRCCLSPAHGGQGRASPATQVRGREVLWSRQGRQERLPDREFVVRWDLEER